MNKEVFISYARRVSTVHARALHASLGGEDGLAFLDSAEIENGQQFPKMLCEALLDARVVVIFAEEDYFIRWYCLRELQLALAPYVHLFKLGRPSGEDLIAALKHAVVALPPGGARPQAMNNLPPLLQTTDWPTANQTEKLAAQVHERLEQCPASILERLGDGPGQALLASLLQETAVPPPGNLSGLKVFPPQLSQSLGENFIGRADDLWRIHFILSTMRGEAAAAAALTGALHAAGGFGKTRLATEYLWRFGSTHYDGGLFWVDADVSEDLLTQRLHGILKTLQPKTTPELAAFREAKRDVRNELASAFQSLPAGQTVLFVVDNIPEPPPGQTPRSLKHWCPALGRVTVLATSRMCLAIDASVRALSVDVLPRAAAVLVLTRNVNRAELPELDWLRIAEWVGFLPLALELLNGVLVLGGFTPRQLLARLDCAGITQELDKQMDALREQVPEGVLRGITEALSVSYVRLNEAQRRAARLLAHLAPKPIPERLLEAFHDEFTSAVRNALRARSFIRPVGSVDVPMFGQMHRVLADFLLAQSPDWQTELLEVCNALFKAFPDRGLDLSQLREVEPLSVHFEFVLSRMGFGFPITTTILVERFFRYLLEGLSKGDSLKSAQRYLQSVTVAELGEWFRKTKRWRLPEGNASWATRLDPLRHFSPDARPFADPKYWDNIILQGDAGPLTLGQAEC
jgi:hypothetical protein